MMDKIAEKIREKTGRGKPDEPADPSAMLSEKIAALDDDPPLELTEAMEAPAGDALQREVAARMREVTGIPDDVLAPVEIPLRARTMQEVVAGLDPPCPSAPPPLTFATTGTAPPQLVRPPADYTRERYLPNCGLGPHLWQSLGFVGNALVRATEPDYGKHLTALGIARQFVLTDTIIVRLLEQFVGADKPSDDVALACRECLAAERQIRDRLLEIERKLER